MRDDEVVHCDTVLGHAVLHLALCCLVVTHVSRHLALCCLVVTHVSRPQHIALNDFSFLSVLKQT